LSGSDSGCPADAVLFPGFRAERIRTREAEIQAVVGGQGPPVLLLHGYPQTHACWHRLAPALAERFTVVCADLRGYGDSGRPSSDAAHRAYSKRVMAEDQREVMARLGFERFAVVGHDRGGRVAYRLALDHPDRVTHLAVLDIVPTLETWARLDWCRPRLLSPLDPGELGGARSRV
jgi:haloacetate dehalogenase